LHACLTDWPPARRAQLEQWDFMDAMLTFESDMFCNVTRLRQAGYDGQVRSPAARGQALVAIEVVAASGHALP
jgi:hypothetical protein